MAANYLHGVETIEIESGPRAIQIVKSAVIVLVGTAPFGPVNVLTQCLSERTAAQFGPRLAGFTMPYAFKAIFDHGAGTVLAINVCDPTRHSSAIMAESVTFGTNNLAQLSRCAIQSITIAGKQEGVDFILDYHSQIGQRCSHLSGYAA
ncbi:Phage tail sheath protein [Yersinia pseudotuberculosis]|nr:Phage tail sheath protein [Yersinia pseudotuberculosis]